MNLYGEMILEHARHPQHAGLRDGEAAQVHHVNPSCGDEVTLRVHLDGDAGADPVLTDLSYAAQGCSISVAATSMLAQECVGEPVSASLALYRDVHAMLTSRGTDPGDPEQIGDAVALAGVARYPMRVKCALLGWSAYLDALARAGVDISGMRTSNPHDPAGRLTR